MEPAQVCRVLRRFKNVVLEGPPGVGKTHLVGRIATVWEDLGGQPLGGDGRGEWALTFHPSTTYEQFVDGLRYDEDAKGFIRKRGFILNVVEQAEGNPDKDYLVLLDEINRANVPKVLGDLLLCMEPSKRTHFEDEAWSGGLSVTLPYSGDVFSMPDNVYLIGTMNSTDRSIAPLDSALRRRFGFVRVPPLLGASLQQAIENAEGAASAQRAAASVDELTNLNMLLGDCLGPDAMLGHSYLFGMDDVLGGQDADDPLHEVRDVARGCGSNRVLWMQVSTLSGGSGNQLDIPDNKTTADGTVTRQGLVDDFFPMSTNAHVTAGRSPRGVTDKFDLHFRGRTFIDNSLLYNAGGNNYRMRLGGKTVVNEGITSVMRQHYLANKVVVWVARPDDTFEMLVLDRIPGTVEALKGLSQRTDRTPSAQGRWYGVLDVPALLAPAPQLTTTDEQSDDDLEAEWLTWRYTVLPQLVDTLTQLSATDLFDPSTRADWLKRNDSEGLADRFAQFDQFMARLRLTMKGEGYGLSRALSIKELPVGAAVEDAALSMPDGLGDADNEPETGEDERDLFEGDLDDDAVGNAD